MLQCHKSKRGVSEARAREFAGLTKSKREKSRVFCRSREIVARLSLNRMTQHKGIQRIIKALCVFTSFLFSPFRAELAEAKKRAKTYKERKKHDRFDGMPEEEVSKRVLPDHLTNNLDIIIVSPSAL